MSTEALRLARERTAFEAEMADRWDDLSRDASGFRDYAELNVECAWIGWLARAESASPADSLPATFDTKALATAQAIAFMWGRDRSQFVSRIQCAVLEAMRWAVSSSAALDALPAQAEPAAYVPVMERGPTDTAHSEMLRLLDLCARQAAELESLRKNDARYRWLCANNFDRGGATQVHTWLHTWEPHSQTGEPTEWEQRIRGSALDAAIDAAMSTTPQEQR